MSGHTVSQGGENAGAVFPALDATVTAPDFASVLAAHYDPTTCAREHGMPADEPMVQAHCAHVAAALHAELVAWLIDFPWTETARDDLLAALAQVAPTRVPSEES